MLLRIPFLSPFKELITKHENTVLRYTRTLRTTDDTWNGPFDDFPELVKICCLCLFLRGSLYFLVWVQWWNYVPLARSIVNKCINHLLHLVCVRINNNNNNFCAKLFICLIPSLIVFCVSSIYKEYHV